MSRREELLPPRYTVVPVRLLPGEGLSRPVLMTGLIIWSLGWKYQYKRTERVTHAELCELCGVARRQLYEHLRVLQDAEIIQYDRPKRDGYVFRLLDGDDVHRDQTWFEPAVRGGAADDVIGQQNKGPLSDSAVEHLPPSESAENCTLVDMIVVVDSDTESDSVNKLDQQQQVSHGLGSRGECEGGAVSVRKTAVMAGLDRLGVLEPTRSELAGLEHVTVEYLERWAEYLETRPELGTGWLVIQVRAGVQAPRVGRKAYLTGRYGKYIQS